MPQAGSKTGVYRSFITCEDPKGVVECGMKMRRSKSNGGSHIMDEPKKVEVRRNPKNLSTRSSSLELISQEDEHLQSCSTSSSSFRIMEVSRGAQRLNNMIDSWPNEKKKDIFATDLLKGALDLQESLVMLGKLQEASQYMSNFNMKKHERAYSDRYEDQHYVKPRPSSIELKKVIRDSLVRQKLLSTSETGSVYSYSESTPSTSSSQSSSLCHNTSEHSSISSQKVKGPSLIAKLMGIDEYPMKSLQDAEMVVYPQRPSFEIDRLNVTRKPQNVDLEKRTLKEVLDTMRFKGLLRNNSFEELKFESHHSSSLELSKRCNAKGVSPPIVLIKPICVESSEKEANSAKATVTRGEEAFDNRRMLKKLAPIRTRGEVDKHGEKETKTINLAAKKAKGSQHVHHKPHEAIDKRVVKIQKVAADNRKPVEKDIPKAKSVSNNKSDDKEKPTLIKKARKPESGSNNTKTRVSGQPSSVTSTSSKCTTAAHNAESESRRNRLKKEQPVKKPREVKSVTKNVVSEEIVKRTSISDESESSLISSNADPGVQQTKEGENKTYGSHSEGYSNSVLSFLSDATSLCSMQDTNSETAEEVSEDISQCVKNEKTVGGRDNLREFLLSSASFLGHVEECYNLNVNGSTIFRVPSISTSAMCNTRLVLDCASELVECKSFRQKTVSPTTLTSQGKPIVSISLHKLVEDVCNGIETLRRYSKLASENTIADSLFVMLERDVMCKGVGKETWDLSWRVGFSDEEVEQVVSDIERLVFNGLIEEVFA